MKHVLLFVIHTVLAEINYIDQKPVPKHIGDPLSITCNINAPVKWTLDDEKISVTASTLHFLSLKLWQAGVYECKGLTNDGKKARGWYKLYIDLIRDKDVFQQPVRVSVGFEVIIICRIAKKVSWHYKIPNKQDNNIIEESDTLRIKKVSIENEGYYNCQNRPNIYILVKASYHLTVYEQKYIKPRQRAVTELQNTMILCKSEVTSIWSFNNGKLPPNAIVNESNTNILNIYIVTQNNQGYYECAGSANRGTGIYPFHSYCELSIYGDKMSDMQIYPQHQTVLEGRLTLITCFSKTIIPHWTFRGKTMNLNESVHVMKQVRKEDAGEYTCEWRDSNKVPHKGSSILLVNFIAHFIKIPSPAIAGTDILISCHRGVRKWKFNNGMIPKNAAILQQDGALQIADLKPSNGGVYMCEGNTDKFVSFTSEDILNVQVVLENNIRTIPEKPILGKEVEIFCEKMNWPQWKFNGDPLTDIVSTLSDPPHVHIKSASYFHAGVYSCESAPENFAYEKGEKEVFFYDQDVVAPTQSVLKEGLTARFECKSIVQPKWTFHQKPLPSNAIVLSPSRSSSVLMIFNVKDFNSGDYECEGQKQENTFISYVSLIVLSKQDRIIPDSINTSLGRSDVVFTCQSTSTVTWSLNGKPLPSNVIVSEDSKQIQIFDVNLNNIGYYECVGKDQEEYSDFYSTSKLSIKVKCLETSMKSGWALITYENFGEDPCGPGFRIDKQLPLGLEEIHDSAVAMNTPFYIMFICLCKLILETILYNIFK